MAVSLSRIVVVTRPLPVDAFQAASKPLNAGGHVLKRTPEGVGRHGRPRRVLTPGAVVAATTERIGTLGSLGAL